jgi:hypothetical protein
LSDFIREEFLQQNFREFHKILVNHQNEEKEQHMAERLMVLIAGCHINEIEKRLGLGAELCGKWPEYFEYGEKVQELKEEWENEKKEGQLREIKKYNKSEMELLEKYLYQNLR